jgi:hypothetical protein
MLLMSRNLRVKSGNNFESRWRQLEFSCGFLTQKELDPDFVDFNSVNRRYHFPARFYLPFRGVFAQVDPLSIEPQIVVSRLSPKIARFVYAAALPT